MKGHESDAVRPKTVAPHSEANCSQSGLRAIGAATVISFQDHHGDAVFVCSFRFSVARLIPKPVALLFVHSIQISVVS